MTRLRINNLLGTILDSPKLAAGATTMTVPSSFPVVAAPNVVALSIEPDTANEEVVYVTAHASGATTATIVRGQEGGIVGGIDHLNGVAWKHGPTQSDFWTGADFSVSASYYAAQAGRADGKVGGAKVAADGVIYAGEAGISTGGRGPFAMLKPLEAGRPTSPWAPRSSAGNLTNPNVLRSSTAQFTAADVGKTVVVAGAGANGLALITTIQSVPGPDQAVLTASASTTVSGAYFAWGWDDSAAFRAAANDAAAANRPGTVYVAPDTYLLASAVPTACNWVLDGVGLVAAANLTGGLLQVVGGDVQVKARGTFYGLGCLCDCINVQGQVNTELNLHMKAVWLGLPLTNATAPTATAQAGSTTLPTGSYTFLAAYVDPIGSEATAGVGTVVSVTSGQQVLVTASNVPAAATGVNFYVASAPAGVNTGLIATVAPSGGSASTTFTLPYAGDNRLIPVTNRSGSNLVNSINGDGLKVEGWLTSADSALVRMDGTSNAHVTGIKGGPYIRDPLQPIVNMGDLQGQGSAGGAYVVTGLKLSRSHVHGGGILTVNAQVMAQWGGGRAHIRNVEVSDISTEYTSLASLADGLDVIQIDNGTITGTNFYSCGGNGLNVSGCNQVSIGPGTSWLTYAPGLQFGDPTVNFQTNEIQATGFNVLNCGLLTSLSGVVIYAPSASGSTNLITCNNCQTYGTTTQLYGVTLSNGSGGTFAGVQWIGGWCLGSVGTYADASTGAPSISFIGTQPTVDLPFAISTSVTTVSANTTADQNLSSASIAGNRMNGGTRTLRVFAAGVFSTQAVSQPAITFKLKFGGVTLLSWSVAAPGAQVAGDGWSILAYITTVTTGSSGTVEAHGTLHIDTGALTAAATVFVDNNNAVSSAINLTAAQTLQPTIAFTTNASTSNTCTSRQLVAEILNAND